MHTIIIKNGTIIDGSGMAPYNGSVYMKGEEILSVRPASTATESQNPDADSVVDATGCIVAPGFIDMHSHIDWQLPLADHPSLLKRLPEQGITTVIGGNCGFSPAPVDSRSTSLLDLNLSALLMDKPIEYQWRSMGEYLDQLERNRSIVNIAQLVGHATVRALHFGLDRHVLPSTTLNACLETTRKSLNEGAAGISFGLGYDPGMYAPLDEIEAFCRVAAETGKPVTVHLKALSRLSPTYSPLYLKPHNLRALNEILAIACKTGVRTQLSHFIFVGRRSWSLYKRALKAVMSARERGADVMFDAFPYTCGNTTINVVFPYWFIQDLPRSYHRKSSLLRLRAELEAGFRLLGFNYRDFQVMDPVLPEWSHLAGRTITEIAELWETSPFKAFLRLSEATSGNALMLFHTYSGEPGNETALDTVISHPCCLLETDAIIKRRGYPNPAGLGTFPKILGNYVRDKQAFSLEAAIHRMTGASAERFRLADRGLLKPGYKADVVIFDPHRVDETPPEGLKPAGRPKGIRHVYINGQTVVENECYIDGAQYGHILRL